MSYPPPPPFPWELNPIVSQWRCHPYAERQVVALLADLVPTPAAFLDAGVVDAIFAIAAPTWSVKRREVFEWAYSCPRQEIIIGGSTFEGYYPPLAWAGDVYQARLAGQCQVSEPLCPRLTWP